MIKIRKYTYGPFQSRRLGLSLGVNILPEEKVCSYNCVYCELGKSDKDQLVSQEYRIDLPPKQSFRKELNSILKYFPHLDSISFSGYYGEPTLNKHLTEYLSIARNVRDNRIWNGKKPDLTLFTNSSTLYSKDVRKIIGDFDVILAKLDAATQEDFLRTNRPHKAILPVDKVIQSIATLRKEMPCENKLTLQCLLYRSYREDFLSNANKRNVRSLGEAIKQIKPNEVQIYSIARTPAEYYVYALDKMRLTAISNKLQKLVNDRSIDIIEY